jgi:hypothetical protein
MSIFFVTVLPLLVKRLSKYFQPNSVTLQISGSEVDQWRKLEAIGLQMDSLPESLGGTWSYDEFDRWFTLEKLASKINNSLKRSVYDVTSEVNSGIESESKSPLVVLCAAAEEASAVKDNHKDQTDGDKCPSLVES